jgi:hypothetical protein
MSWNGNKMLRIEGKSRSLVKTALQPSSMSVVGGCRTWLVREMESKLSNQEESDLERKQTHINTLESKLVE